MSKYNAGDKIMYTEDHNEMKDKLAYVVISIGVGEILVETQTSPDFKGLSRSEMIDHWNRRGNTKVIEAIMNYQDRIDGRFCHMEEINTKIVEKGVPEPVTRNETYLFPDIKDLK